MGVFCRILIQGVFPENNIILWWIVKNSIVVKLFARIASLWEPCFEKMI